MSDLTIVLPLKDRLNFTKRWLSYAKIYYKDFKILVCDGSKEKYSDFAIKGNYYFKDLDIRYYKYPYDENIELYFNKLSDSLKKVKTEFCVLSDNDDFFNPEALNKSVKFLSNNSDYSTCGGQHTQFKVTKKKNFLNLAFFKDNIISSNKIDEPLDRLSLSFSKKISLPLFYDVHRTSEISNTYNLLKNMQTNELQMVEIFPQFCDAINGKNMKLSNLYISREIQMTESAHREYIQKEGNAAYRIIFSNFAQDYKKMVDLLINEFSKKNNKNILEPEDIIKKHSIIYLKSLIIGKKRVKDNSFYKRFKKKYIHYVYFKKTDPYFLRNVKNFLENYKKK